MIYFVSLIFRALNWLVSAYILLIVVYALLSWLPGGYESKFGRIVGRLVEPFLSYFNFISLGPIGFGPVVAIVVLSLVQYGIQYLGMLVLQLMIR
ncbi:YggT family protein [Levilactobacillus enshiensis]|uniref:YggT family protein n=1 Tax=Levilactobacillus enshiensis TaxID=2590213 RepID=UPI00117AEF65|nr:YggT family protein [Levilactobacillus enshiensis]